MEIDVICCITCKLSLASRICTVAGAEAGCVTVGSVADMLLLTGLLGWVGPDASDPERCRASEAAASSWLSIAVS